MYFSAEVFPLCICYAFPLWDLSQIQSWIQYIVLVVTATNWYDEIFSVSTFLSFWISWTFVCHFINYSKSSSPQHKYVAKLFKKVPGKKICVVETECPEEARIAQVFLLLNSLFLPMYAFRNSQTSIMIIGKSWRS